MLEQAVHADRQDREALSLLVGAYASLGMEEKSRSRLALLRRLDPAAAAGFASRE